ncbi:hypothetical protein BGZ96_000652, partial [Linnemannia gamsii]
MSDTDNAHLSFSSITPEDLAKIKAILDSSQQPITSIELPRTKQLVISDEAKDLIPSISGEHFFFPPDDPEGDNVSPKDLLFDKNPHQQYR